MMLLRRILTLVLTVSVPLIVAALPAGAAESASAQAVSCPRVVLIGVHGIEEGPSPTAVPQGDPAQSPTIQATFTAFSKEVGKLPNDGTSHSYLLHWVSYPVLPRSDFTSYTGLRTAMGVLGAAATKVYNYVASEVDNCPGTLVSAVGFSAGAWIINIALTQHYYMAGLLNLAAMEGDPCWSNTSDGTAGLAQRAQEIGFHFGCLDSATYPYLTFANPYTAQSVCMPNDPVCGEGYSPNLVSIAQQLLAAGHCSKANGCPHYNYPKGGAAAYVGKWLADYAFV